MKIPKTLQIGGKTYSIITGYKFKERSDLVGYCDTALQQILLSATDGQGNKAHVEHIGETFFHEVLHAIDAVYNAGKLEEETVSGLSEGLFQVFKQL